MPKSPEPPPTYQRFVARFPKVAAAWETASQAGAEGPLDAREVRLVKLGIAIGALREGAVRAGARKAVAMGISQEELDQVTALAVGTLGFPGTVAVFSWIEEALARLEAS